jgi:putative flippase GtrA
MANMKGFYTILGRQVAYFTLTGCLSTLLMYVIYLGCKPYIGYQFAYALGYIISVIALYFANRILVFRQHLSWVTFIKFSGVYFLQYLVSAVLLECLVRLGFSETFAPLLIILLLLPITFLLTKKV